MITDTKSFLEQLVKLHESVPGTWSTEIRKGGGWNIPEVIFATTTVESTQRIADAFGVQLRMVDSVKGDTEWLDGEARIAGIRVRVSGPHSPKAQAVQP